MGASHSNLTKRQRFKKWLGKKRRNKATQGSLSTECPEVDTLEETYFQLVSSKKIQDYLKETFKQVRILVIGKSGSGKSTLIRLIVENDSVKIVNGKAGEQDIDLEWQSNDSELPFVFHDTNGMDVQGRSRLATIEKFLKKRKNASFAEQIHLIWYVVNGTENRFLDDGGALELLSAYKIPLLVIITHCDRAAAVQAVLTESARRELVGRIKAREFDPECHVIKVANDVTETEDGELEIKSVDYEALERLSSATKQLMDQSLNYTWAAAQAVNTHDKLDASAQLIVSCKRRIFWTSAVGAIPFANATNVALTLTTIFKSLCLIWRVPPNFVRALYRHFALQEATKGVCETALFSLLQTVGLAATITTTVLTAGITFPSVVGLVTAVGEGNRARRSMLILISFASLILGSILYVKSIQEHRCTGWDADKSINYYKELCDKFSASRYFTNLKRAMTDINSIWETAFRRKEARRKIKLVLIECFDELILKRPNSFFTVAGWNKQTHTSPQVSCCFCWKGDHANCSRDSNPGSEGNNEDE